MSYAQKLEELLTKEVIPDIDDRLDEIFETIAGEKMQMMNKKKR